MNNLKNQRSNEIVLQETNKINSQIEEHDNCSFCGNKLDFKHYMNYEDFKLTESSNCNYCQIVVNKKEHNIH